MAWPFEDQNTNQDLLPYKKVIQDAVSRVNVPQNYSVPNVGQSAIPERPQAPNAGGDFMGPLMDTINALQAYASKNIGGSRGTTAAQGHALAAAGNIMGGIQQKAMGIPGENFRTEAGMHINDQNVGAQNRGQDLNYLLGMEGKGSNERTGVLDALIKAAGLEQNAPLTSAHANYYNTHGTPTPFNAHYGDQMATMVRDQNAPGGYRILSSGTGPKAAGSEGALAQHAIGQYITGSMKIDTDMMMNPEQKAAAKASLRSAISEFIPGFGQQQGGAISGPAQGGTTPSGRPKPALDVFLNEMERNNPGQFTREQLQQYYVGTYGPA